MPFTFAHPAAIIPLRRLRKLDVVALTFGAMAPDFDYFLAGRPHEWFGHHWIGMITLNLWITLLLSFCYRRYWHEPLMAHTPFVHAPLRQSPPWLWTIISAWLGMITHISWDAFTHQTGFVVTHVPLLTTERFRLPLYKLAQHGSTLVGFTCLLFVLWTPHKRLTKQRLSFWLTTLFSSALLFTIWFYIWPWSLTLYGTTVVRAIDCFLVVLIVLCTVKQKQKT